MDCTGASRTSQHISWTSASTARPGEIVVTGVVDETRFHFFKLRMVTTITTRVGQTGLEIRDTVENFSGSPTDIQMLYHINFGPPVLGPGAQVVVPVKTLVPRTPLAAAALPEWSRYPPPQASCQEQVYFFELQGDDHQQTAVLLKDAQSARGVSVHFNTRQLPCFTLWKNPTAEADGYVTGLEPATNYPNPRSFEQQQGRVVALQPGGKCTFDVQLQVHPTAAEVSRHAAADRIAAEDPGHDPSSTATPLVRGRVSVRTRVGPAGDTPTR